MKKAQDRHKSYENNIRKPLEFKEGDHIFLKVTPRCILKGPFKSWKLSMIYTGPCHIIEWIGKVAYRLALPPSLSRMHDIFHVSQLQKFILPDTVEVESYLSFESQPSHIVGCETKVLRNKEISIVKVQWDKSYLGETNWELEYEMREAYPYIFHVIFKLEDVFSFWGCNTPCSIRYTNLCQLRSTEVLYALLVVSWDK